VLVSVPGVGPVLATTLLADVPELGCLNRKETLFEETLGTSGRRAAAPSSSERLDDLDRAHIERVVEACGWRIHGKGNAAEKLRLHPNTLATGCRNSESRDRGDPHRMPKPEG
jgi:hypothetical protein